VRDGRYFAEKKKKRKRKRKKKRKKSTAVTKYDIVPEKCSPTSLLTGRIQYSNKEFHVIGANEVQLVTLSQCLVYRDCHFGSSTGVKRLSSTRCGQAVCGARGKGAGSLSFGRTTASVAWVGFFFFSFFKQKRCAPKRGFAQ
jgi:hypothetical protein